MRLISSRLNSDDRLQELRQAETLNFRAPVEDAIVFSGRSEFDVLSGEVDKLQSLRVRSREGTLPA